MSETFELFHQASFFFSQPLAGGNAPACWQRAMARSTARLRTLRLLSMWPLTYASINPLPSDLSLFGDYLSELVMRAQQPSQSDSENPRSSNSHAAARLSPNARERSRTSPARATESQSDARSNRNGRDERSRTRREPPSSPQSTDRSAAEAFTDAASADEADATEPPGGEHAPQRWPAGEWSWPFRYLHPGSMANVERVERRPSLPLRGRERPNTSGADRMGPSSCFRSFGSMESFGLNPPVTRTGEIDGSHTDSSLPTDSPHDSYAPSSLAQRGAPDVVRRTHRSLPPDAGFDSGDDGQSPLPLSFSVSDDGLASAFPEHSHGERRSSQPASEALAELPEQVTRSLLARLSSGPASLPSDIDFNPEAQALRSLPENGDDKHHGIASARGEQSLSREFSTPPRSQRKKSFDSSSAREEAIKPSAREPGSSSVLKRTKAAVVPGRLNRRGSSSALPAEHLRTEGGQQAGVFNSAHPSKKALAWTYEKEVRHVWQDEVARRVENVIRRSRSSAKLSAVEPETEVSLLHQSPLTQSIEVFEAHGREVSLLNRSPLTRQWLLSLRGPIAPPNLWASIAASIQFDGEARQSDHAEGQTPRRTVADEKAQTPLLADQSSASLTGNHEPPPARNRHRQNVMPYAEEGVRQMPDGDWTDFSLSQQIAPPAVAPALPTLIPPQMIDMPILPVASETARQAARVEATVSDDDMEALAAKMKFILDEQARRHGIEV